MTAYKSYPKFYVSVDCIIFGFKDGRLKVLIHQRPYEPGLGEHSLIGGFVQTNESVDSSAKRILKEFTGLDNVYMQQLAAYGEVERDPGERVISVVYYALINVDNYDTHLADIHKTQWVDVDQMPTLCFDHNGTEGSSHDWRKHQKPAHREQSSPEILHAEFASDTL